MKLVDYLVFSLTVAFFIIGVHQTFTVGLGGSYWIFMFCIGFLLIYKVRKNKLSQEESSVVRPDKGTAKTKASKKTPLKTSTNVLTNPPVGKKKPDESSGPAKRDPGNPQPTARK